MRKRSISSFAAPIADAPAEPASADETVLAAGPARTMQTTLSQSIADAPRLEVGQMLNGRFVLAQRLGEGGMGTVYKALDLRKQEAQDRTPFVALKVPSEDFRRHPEALKSLQRGLAFDREARTPDVATFVADVTARSWWRRNALPLIGVAALAAGAAATYVYFEQTAPEQIGVAAPKNPSVSQVD
jgi:hypothetical protein